MLVACSSSLPRLLTSVVGESIARYLGTDSLVERGNAVFLNNYGPRSAVFERAEGCHVWDSTGKQYLDLSSGIAVNSLGHGHPVVVEWLTNAKNASFLHVSNYYMTKPSIELAEQLISKAPAGLERVFFANSGTEANEAALKFAKLVHPDREGRVVAFQHGFHGRSMGSLSVTHKPAIREQFAPLVPGASFFPYNCSLTSDSAEAEHVRTSIRRAGAVIVEPIQGEGGVRPADAAFLAGLRRLCDETSTLMIIDEVQTGCSRTGSLWAHEQYGVQPDLLTLAKPLAGGLPIGAVLCKSIVHAAVKPSDHGSTFAGGPFVTGLANAVFKVLSSPALLDNVRARGAQFYRRLMKMKESDRFGIVDVRTSPNKQGLLIGVEFATPVADLVAACADAGLILITAGPNVIRLAPPLIISEEEVERALEIIEGKAQKAI